VVPNRSPWTERTEKGNVRAFKGEGAEILETPVTRSRAARGVITGVLLGAVLWGAILMLVGVIKL